VKKSFNIQELLHRKSRHPWNKAIQNKTNKQTSFIDRYTEFLFFFLICIEKSENCGYITYRNRFSDLAESRDDNRRGSDPLFPITAQPWFAVHLSVFCFFLFVLNSFSSVPAREREGEEDKRLPARMEDKTQTPGRKNPQQRIAGTGIESNQRFGAPQLTSD
jgi:hypothetical protein